MPFGPTKRFPRNGGPAPRKFPLFPHRTNLGPRENTPRGNMGGLGQFLTRGGIFFNTWRTPRGGDIILSGRDVSGGGPFQGPLGARPLWGFPKPRGTIPFGVEQSQLGAFGSSRPRQFWGRTNTRFETASLHSGEFLQHRPPFSPFLGAARIFGSPQKVIFSWRPSPWVI